ncbi:MAG: glutamyl-tRNA(Gln) amidotransferase, subunit [Pseudomonadota bacterium]|jgi:aspartyl-tRNA(Asn)/glutamyl-tRNA(Gln) amidotransferase subunit A
MAIIDLSIAELRKKIQQRELSATQLSEAFLNRIKELDPKLNSFITVNERVMDDARELDKRIAAGENVGPLAGLPLAIKDMLCTKGIKTTAASKMLNNFVPPYDSTVVAKLKKAGALVIGKTNLDEFAMGSSNETSFYGSVKNPWNLDCVPGGSSGGSAAAQAARLAVASIGTDTGGSIRQPASFCGIVGIKPTYGRVSRYGIVAYASSLDQAGPMTSTVADAAEMLEVISGHDIHDSTSSQKSVPTFTQSLRKDLKGMKIGLIREYETDAISADVRKTVENAIATAKSLGAEVVEVQVPLTQYAVPIYYLVAASEASSNLARYDGVRYGYRADYQNLSAVELEKFYCKNRGQGFGEEVQRRIMLGTYALSSGYYDAYYNKAGQVRRLLTQEFQSAFEKCDVILSPVSTTAAFKIGERISDPLAMYLNDIFTTSTNLAGLPGMSVPFGFSAQGMPIGIQLTATHFQEEKLFAVASALEAAANISDRRPNVI